MILCGTFRRFSYGSCMISMVLSGSRSVLVVLCCSHWFLQVLSGSRRFSVVLMFLVVLVGSQWFSVVLVGFQ